MKEVQGKVAVVTGAASGIGRGMAEAFLEAGMKVVLADVDPAALERTAQELQSHAVRTDVTKLEDVQRLAQETIARHGAVHVLCNNAGVMVGGKAGWRSSLDDWRWALDVNLMGVLHGMHTFLPLMVEQDSEAHIVNTASVAGLVPHGGAPYVTTKYAVVGMSESIAKQLEREKLRPRLSILCPGFVDTNILVSERPERYGPPVPDSMMAKAADRLKQEGMSPRAVGDQVLRAILEERLYVLTHPEHRPLIEERFQAILAGPDASLINFGRP